MISNQSQHNQDLNKTKEQLISELEQLRTGEFQGENSNFFGSQEDLLAQLNGFLDVADAALISTDSDFRIQLFSAGAQATFGYTFEEVFNRSIDMLLPGDVREIHRQHLESFAKGSDVIRLMGERSDVHGQRKNGQRFPAEASIVKISVEGKTHFTVLLRDISERKRGEESFRFREARLKLIADSLPASIMYMDSQQRYRFTNKTYEKWMGLDPGEIKGRTLADVVPPEICDIIRPNVERVLEGENVDFEGKIKFPDGKTRHIFSQLIPDIDTEDGTVRGFSGLIEDITENKKREKHLLESQKMEAVGQLAGGIAHEFNNTMQVILNSAFFIQEEPENSDLVLKFASLIIKSAERTCKLTQQLLGFSRKSFFQPKVLNLGELVSNQINIMGRLMGEQIIIEFNRDVDLDLVNADPEKIEQVILNLCVNSRDAMPNGGNIIIEIKNFIANQEFSYAHGLNSAGKFVTLSVSDNGFGISGENQLHIFEPFFTTKEVGEGTGLGLAMVYGAIQQHGGVIEVSSEPDAGCTFQIFLPALEYAEPTTPQHPDLELPGGGQTILIAEDDDVVRTQLSSMLERQGYVVLCAKDGMDALEVFNANQEIIDLVILDMIMPRKQGRDVYFQIREMGSDVPVLFSSGYSPNDHEFEFLNENGLRLIKKPYSSDELFTHVREILDLR